MSNSPLPQKVAVKVFTTVFGGIVRTLITDVGVGSAFDRNAGEQPPKLQQLKAIWDTGATNTVVSTRAVRACGLKPTGMTKVHDANNTSDAETYLICLLLPNGPGFSSLRVTKSVREDFGDDADLLIGMDVIGRGDFAVTNFSGQTVMTFRSPSVERIDFVAQSRAGKTIVRDTPKVGRNDLCPCGSGKKYKYCHGQ